MTAAAQAIGVKLILAEASSDGELDGAFARIAGQKAAGLVVQNDVFFNSRPARLTALAARYALPTIYEGREYASAGGLISYGPSRTDAYRQLGLYAGRVLDGVKPGDLPVQQPTKFELIINRQVAEGLGLIVPASLLAGADEVIE